jgi:hypothetical protein
MARKLPLAVVLVVALLGAGVASAGSSPILRSAAVSDRHVVVRVDVSDLVPVELVAAENGAKNARGALLAANVRFREAIRFPASAAGTVRWETAKRLAPGTYYVQVMAIETGGVTDCPPGDRQCTEQWSNVQRVVVR